MVEVAGACEMASHLYDANHGPISKQRGLDLLDAGAILRRIDREKIAHEIARYVTGTDNAWPAYLGQADAIISYLTEEE